MLVVPKLNSINSINQFIEQYRDLHNEQPSTIVSTTGNLNNTKQFLLEILFSIKILKQYGMLKLKVDLFKNRLEEDLISLLKTIFSEYSFEKNIYIFKYYIGQSSDLIDKLSLLLVRYNDKYTPHKKLNL